MIVNHKQQLLINNIISIDYTHIQHNNEHSKLNSFFQGHCAIVEDNLQAKAALNSIYQIFQLLTILTKPVLYTVASLSLIGLNQFVTTCKI